MGKMRITVIGGRDLAVRDMNGCSDPYVRIQWCGQKFKTTVKKATLNPQYEESFDLEVPSNMTNCPPVEIGVWDHDYLSRDDKMGYCTVVIPSLPRGLSQEQWYTLKNGKGTLGIRFTAVDSDFRITATSDPNVAHQQWPCPGCTYVNPVNRSTCKVCARPNPVIAPMMHKAGAPVSPTNTSLGAKPTFQKPSSCPPSSSTWTCSKCTFSNTGTNHCKMCNAAKDGSSPGGAATVKHEHKGSAAMKLFRSNTKV